MSHTTDRHDAWLTAEDGQDFDLLVPMSGGGRARPPTHVITLHGSEAEFVTALHNLLIEDDFAARALRGPVGTISLGHLADMLNSLGPATVQSIDRM